MRFQPVKPFWGDVRIEMFEGQVSNEFDSISLIVDLLDLFIQQSLRIVKELLVRKAEGDDLYQILPAPITHFEASKRKEEKAPLERVAESLRGIPEYLMIWLGKTSWMGTMWAWAHNTSMYGCLDILASKLFDENYAKIAIQYAGTALTNCRAIVQSVKAGQTKIKPPDLAKKTK